MEINSVPTLCSLLFPCTSAVEMAQWQDQVAGLQEKLESVIGKQTAAEAEKEHCKARENALQESL